MDITDRRQNHFKNGRLAVCGKEDLFHEISQKGDLLKRHDDVTKIENFAFTHCESLTLVVIPDGVMGEGREGKHVKENVSACVHRQVRSVEKWVFRGTNRNGTDGRSENLETYEFRAEMPRRYDAVKNVEWS